MVDLYCRPARSAVLAGVVAALSALSLQAPARAATTDIEVVHYLANRADAQRVTLLRDTLKSRGYGWKDFTIANGWTGRSESILRFRVQSGNAPAAAMMKAPFMHYWASSGALLPLDEVAAAQRWDEMLPKPIAESLKHKGRYYAVPLNIHRVNWLWLNERILKESGAAVPTTWDQFFVVAEAMKRAGYAAVAYYGRDTQNLLLFEIVAFGVGGPAFHRKALLEYDAAELSGPVMEKVLLTYRRIKGYVERPDHAQVSMERGMSMFQTGQVGMHLMGDWANPAYYPPDRAAPFKSLCVPAPGSGNHFLFTSDAIAMFRGTDAATQKGQLAFADALMTAAVQHDYSVQKGSIPARLGVELDGYHGCAVKTAASFRAATQAGTLVAALSMTAHRAVEDGIQEVVTDFWNSDQMTPQAAMSRLVTVTRRR